MSLLDKINTKETPSIIAPNHKKGSLSFRLLLKKSLGFPELWLVYGLVLVVYLRWFLPGQFSDGDAGYPYPEWLKDYIYFPTWDSSNQLGSSQLPVFSRIFINITHYLLTVIGIDTFLAARLVFYIPFVVIAPASMYFMMRVLFKVRVAAAVAALLFAISPDMLIRGAGGHILLIYAWAVTPLLIGLLYLAVQRRVLGWAIVIGWVTVWTVMWDLRTAYSLVFVMLTFGLWLFWTDRAKFVPRTIFYLKVALLVTVIPLLTLLYFIVPIGLGGGAVLPLTYDDNTWVYQLSNRNIARAFAYVTPGYPYTVPANTPLLDKTFLLPILGAIAVLWRRRSRWVIYFLGLYLLGIFLVKGTNAPFGEIYRWLFNYFPGFSAFRDSNKWVHLVLVSLPVLVGLAVEEIKRGWEQVLKPRWQRAGQAALLVVGIGTIVWLFQPAFFQQISGVFVNYSLPSWQHNIEKRLNQDREQFYRVLWAPDSQSFIPYSNQHPALRASLMGSFASLGGNTRPFVALAGSAGYSDFLRNRTAYNLLRLLGTKYIFVPDADYMQYFPLPYLSITDFKAAQTATAQIISDVGIARPTTHDYGIPAFELANPQERFFATSQRLYFLGADDLYPALEAMPGFDFGQVAVIAGDKAFATPPFSGQTVLINKQVNFDDVLLRFVDAKNVYPLAASLPRNLAKENPWKKTNLLDGGVWRQWLEQSTIHNYDFDYGLGFVYSTQPGALPITVNTPQAGDYELWVRVLVQPKHASLTVQISDKRLVADLVSNNDKSYLTWYKLGTLNLPSGKSALEVISGQEFTAVNALALVSPSQKANATAAMNKTLESAKVWQLQNFDSQSLQRTGLNNFEGQVTLQAFKPGNYHLMALFEAGQSPLELQGQVGTQTFQFKSDGNRDAPHWYELGKLRFDTIPLTFNFRLGSPNLDLAENLANPAQLQGFMLVEEGALLAPDGAKSSPTPSITYETESPARYRVKVQNATQPFDLIFNMSYDSRWQAKLGDGQILKPEEIYSMLQGYPVTRTGNFELTVEYVPQQFVPLGLILSAVGLLISIGLSWWVLHHKPKTI